MVWAITLQDGRLVTGTDRLGTLRQEQPVLHVPARRGWACCPATHLRRQPVLDRSFPRQRQGYYGPHAAGLGAGVSHI